MRCSVVIMAGGSGERFWPYTVLWKMLIMSERISS